MKLLFDQNLSPILVRRLADLFPESSHVFLLGLDREDNKTVRKYAGENEYIIVTKDADYSDLSLLLGYPPHVIWVRRGNCSTDTIEELLREHFGHIENLSSGLDSGIVTIL